MAAQQTREPGALERWLFPQGVPQYNAEKDKQAKARAALKRAEERGRAHHKRELARRKRNQQMRSDLLSWLFGTSRKKKAKKWYDPF